MKSLIYQLYNEGFATTFCIKPTRFIEKKLKSKKIINFLSILVKILYTILIIVILIISIYIKFFK